LRARRGFAASGNAESRYHCANAQHLPHRLATSIIQHFGVPLLTTADRHAAARIPHRTNIACGELLFRSPVWGLPSRRLPDPRADMEATMNQIIYLVGLIVVVLFILSFFGLR
jgi:hypothetical protein